MSTACSAEHHNSSALLYVSPCPDQTVVKHATHCGLRLPLHSSWVAVPACVSSNPSATEHSDPGCMFLQDERGVSRDEMAAALLEVAEGRVPKDRIALRCLFEEISTWPFLEFNAGGVAEKDPNAVPTAPSDYASLLAGESDSLILPMHKPLASKKDLGT